jgi:hypothetical protein
MMNPNYGAVLLAFALALAACGDPEPPSATPERGETVARAEADLSAIPSLPEHYAVLYTDEDCERCADTNELLEELNSELDAMGAVTVEYDLSAEEHPEIEGLGIADLVEAEAEPATVLIISASSEDEVARFGPETTVDEAREALAPQLPAF